MRKIILFILLFVSTLAYSIPAKRITKTATIDGKQVKLTFTGNEKVHFWLSEDGKKYKLNEDGTFRIYPESSFQKTIASNKFEVKNQEASIPNTPAFAKARAKRKAKYQGQKRGLLILAEFADNTFTSTTNPREDYQKLVAEENYKGTKNYGSVRDYFRAQSYGQFDFVLDVVGPVKLSQEMSYYGGNDRYSDDDLRAGTMVWEACQIADEEVDFSQYDWDGDGEVENVFVLYAGYGEAQSYKANTVWPHAWYLSAAKEYEETIGSCVFDGVTIDSYACGCELAGSRGSVQDGIGTICHEFSHCFGLPDFYCTDYSHTELAMDNWSILDVGSYAGNGYIPVSYTAYERWFCGWLEPTELSSPQFIKGMSNIDENGEAYIIYNDNNPNEYYMLQNIQKKGWNYSAGGHGLLVIHVDYNEKAWDNNTLNNYKDHLRMTPICADNNRSGYNLAGDTYPGTSKNTELTDFSTPAATLFNANTDGKKLMHKPITEIAESSDGLISFTFMGGVHVDIPEALSAMMKGKEITATWNDDMADVTSYNIKYGTLNPNSVEEKIVVNEDFSKTMASSDNNIDISASLDKFLNTPGFTGTKLYSGRKGLKMSTSAVNGELISPVLTESTGNISINLKSEIYGKDVCTLTINVYKAGEVSPFYVSEPIEAGKDTTINVSDVPSEYKLLISAQRRCYLSKLQIIGSESTPYENETLIEGVTSMPYTFMTDLEASEYWMRIQAVGPEGKTSKWSEAVLFTGGANSINNTFYTPLYNAQYNLNGQRVGKDFKGIIIKGGKKYLAH